jgi:hypothetical protein
MLRSKRASGTDQGDRFEKIGLSLKEKLMVQNLLQLLQLEKL